MNEVHLRDFERSKLPYPDYMKQFFIGHYNPRGNHFFAHAIRPKIVDWLDPKPITYRGVDSQAIDFRGYLPVGPDGAASAEGRQKEGKRPVSPPADERMTDRGDDLEPWAERARGMTPGWMVEDLRLIYPHFQRHGLDGHGRGPRGRAGGSGSDARRFEDFAVELVAKGS